MNLTRKPDGTLKNPRHGKHGPLMTAARREEILAQAVTGTRPAAIARVVGLSRNRVDRLLVEPAVQGFIARAREALKVKTLAHAETLVDGSYERITQALTDGDYKAFDAYTRGSHALERIAASASGEVGRREVQVTGGLGVAVGVDAVGELREFLAGVLGLRVVEAEP